MANEKRLIDANALRTDYLKKHRMTDTEFDICYPWWQFSKAIANAPTVDAVELPCKIGDYVWAIRNFKGKKHPQRGIVSDMYFLNDMSLQIVVKYVARGKWGETVFATDKDAYAAIGERRTDD